MKVTGGHRAGFRERGDIEGEPSKSAHAKAAGATRDQSEGDPVAKAVVASIAALTTWNAKLFTDLGDGAMIRLERELERYLSPLFPSSDGRKANGREA